MAEIPTSLEQRTFRAKIAQARIDNGGQKQDPIVRVSGQVTSDARYIPFNDPEGRAPYNMIFGQAPGRVSTISFRVAENIEVDGTPVTLEHNVYATNTSVEKKADSVRDLSLTKGNNVTLTGYYQLRDDPNASTRIFLYDVAKEIPE